MRFTAEAQSRNCRVYVTYAVALLLAGSLLLFSDVFQATFLCLVASFGCPNRGDLPFRCCPGFCGSRLKRAELANAPENRSSAPTHLVGNPPTSETLSAVVLEHRHETIVHVKLLMAMKKSGPRIVRNKLHLNLLSGGHNDYVFHHSSRRFSGELR